MRLQFLLVAFLPASAHACDAGVLWGATCNSAKAAKGDPSCNAWPLGANATSTATTLIWKKGGPGFGGVDNKVRRRPRCMLRRILLRHWLAAGRRSVGRPVGRHC